MIDLKEWHHIECYMYEYTKARCTCAPQRQALAEALGGLREELERRRGCVCCGDDARTVDRYVEKRRRKLRGDDPP